MHSPPNVVHFRQCFETGKIGSTKYHKIVGVEEDGEVRRFVNWLELGVFEALKSKYLDVVLLEIYTVDDGATGEKVGPPSTERATSAAAALDKAARRSLIECFSFKVSYGEDGAPELHLSTSKDATEGATSLPMDSKAQIKKNTSEVLRTLVELTHGLYPLPEHRMLSIKLMYTENTPVDYEPPLFAQTRMEDMCWFDEKPLRVSAGTVSTPYHQLSMSIRTRASGFQTTASGIGKLDVDQNKENVETEKSHHDKRVKDQHSEVAARTSRRVKTQARKGIDKEKSNSTVTPMEVIEVDVGNSQGNSGRVAPKSSFVEDDGMSGKTEMARASASGVTNEMVSLALSPADVGDNLSDPAKLVLHLRPKMQPLVQPLSSSPPIVPAVVKKRTSPKKARAASKRLASKGGAESAAPTWSRMARRKVSEVKDPIKQERRRSSRIRGNAGFERQRDQL